MKSYIAVLMLGIASCAADSSSLRGIADSANDWASFRPMKDDPAKHGLVAVEPYLRKEGREEVLRIIGLECAGLGTWSGSTYDPKTKRGYYVACAIEGGQFLNGYTSKEMAEKK